VVRGPPGGGHAQGRVSDLCNCIAIGIHLIEWRFRVANAGATKIRHVRMLGLLK
jgi:hypothetical protein